jgi:hypothetical protein
MRMKKRLEIDDLIWVVDTIFSRQIICHKIVSTTKKSYWTRVTYVSGLCGIAKKDVDMKGGTVFSDPIIAARRFIELLEDVECKNE